MGIRRKPVTIELDGKERALKYDLNALCMFEEHQKIGITEALQKRSMSAIRALLWVGLIHEDPLLTIEDVGRMEFGSLRDIVTKVVSALNQDQTAPERPTEALEAAAVESTGADSGASDDMTLVLAKANSGL
jgi:hypothetical protein